ALASFDLVALGIRLIAALATPGFDSDHEPLRTARTISTSGNSWFGTHTTSRPFASFVFSWGGTEKSPPGLATGGSDGKPSGRFAWAFGPMRGATRFSLSLATGRSAWASL